MSTWTKRQRYLRENQITYLEYLQTEHWKDLKQRVLASKFPYRCYICGVHSGLELHHKTYKRMGKEYLRDMIWLCREHHEITHEYEQEKRGTKNGQLYRAARSIRTQFKRKKKQELRRARIERRKQRRKEKNNYV